MSTPSDRSRIGQDVPAEPFTVTAEIAKAYAAATADGFDYSKIAPPMSAVIHGITSLMPAAMPAIGDPTRLMKLLHGEHEVRWHRPVKIGETLQTAGVVKAIHDKGEGAELVEVLTRANDASGTLVIEMTWGLFIRGGKKQGGEKKPEAAAKPDRGAPAHTLAWTVAADQSLRYAEASGDRNPIHTDDAIAQMTGLRSKILHGLCTMAFAARAATEKAAGGDPARLKRLKVRFTKPVYPGDTITASLWLIEKTGARSQYAVEVKNQDGVVVLESGVAEIE